MNFHDILILLVNNIVKVSETMKFIVQEGDNEMEFSALVTEGELEVINVPLTKNGGLEIRDAMMIEQYHKKRQGIKTKLEYSLIAKEYEGLNTLEIMELSKTPK